MNPFHCAPLFGISNNLISNPPSTIGRENTRVMSRIHRRLNLPSPLPTVEVESDQGIGMSTWGGIAHPITILLKQEQCQVDGSG